MYLLTPTALSNPSGAIQTGTGLTVPGVESSPSGLMTPMRRIQCQIFTRAYPIPNGTANIMWCSCPNGGGKSFSDRHADIWERYFTDWQGRRHVRFWKGL